MQKWNKQGLWKSWINGAATQSPKKWDRDTKSVEDQETPSVQPAKLLSCIKDHWSTAHLSICNKPRYKKQENAHYCWFLVQLGLAPCIAQPEPETGIPIQDAFCDCGFHRGQMSHHRPLLKLYLCTRGCMRSCSAFLSAFCWAIRVSTAHRPRARALSVHRRQEVGSARGAGFGT